MHAWVNGGGIILARSVEAHVLVHDAASCWVLKIHSLFLDVLHLLLWVILEKFSFAPIISVSSKGTLRWDRLVLDHDGLQFAFHFLGGEILAILNESCLVANINSKRCYIYIYIYIHASRHACIHGGEDGGTTCAADEFTLSHILGKHTVGSKICATFCEKLYSVEFKRVYSACWN